MTKLTAQTLRKLLLLVCSDFQVQDFPTLYLMALLHFLLKQTLQIAQNRGFELDALYLLGY